MHLTALRAAGHCASVPGVRRSGSSSCPGRGSACAGSGVGQRDQSTAPARPSRTSGSSIGSSESPSRTGVNWVASGKARRTCLVKMSRAASGNEWCWAGWCAVPLHGCRVSDVERALHGCRGSDPARRIATPVPCRERPVFIEAQSAGTQRPLAQVRRSSTRSAMVTESGGEFSRATTTRSVSRSAFSAKASCMAEMIACSISAPL